MSFAAAAFASASRAPQLRPPQPRRQQLHTLRLGLRLSLRVPLRLGVRVRASAISALTLAVGLIAAVAVWPPSAAGHGLVGRAFLPVPAWLFAWAAGAVLFVSFVALPRLWSSPRLERATKRRLFGLPRRTGTVCGAIGVGVFVLVVLSGVLGSQVTQGQATAFLISDPMGTGANLFGTAGVKIDYGLVSAALIWYVQVGRSFRGTSPASRSRTIERLLSTATRGRRRSPSAGCWP